MINENDELITTDENTQAVENIINDTQSDYVDENTNNNKSSNIEKESDSIILKNKYKIICGIICVFLVVASIILIRGTINAGISAVFSEFDSSYESEKNKTYDDIYNEYYDIYEKKYHTSNAVTIFLDKVEEIKELEVLSVSDVEYIIENTDDNPDGIISWLEVPGKGSFIVDLSKAEFVKNDFERYVHIILPYPELKDITIDYKNIQKLLFKNTWANDSYRDGENIAKKQLGAADMLIKKEIISNVSYYEAAQESAKSLIIGIVKQLNPDILDLKVDVEFK